MRVGIIGLGIGESHINLFNECRGVRVTHACDSNPEVISKAKKKYHNSDISFSSNEDTILQNPDIDIVSIASFDQKHFSQINKAYKTGKHVFVEKPIVTYKSELEQLCQLFEAHPEIKISSNLTLRSIKVIKKLKNEIVQGKLGDLSFLELQYNYGRIKKITEGWRGDIDSYSITVGGGIHIADLVLWLNTPHKPKRVNAVGNKFHSKDTKFLGRDIISAQIKFDNDSIALLNINFGGVSPHFHKIEIYGTKKTFIHELDRDYFFVERDVKNKDSNHFLNDASIFGKYNGKVNFAAEYEIDSEDNNISDFVSAIKENRDPYLTKNQIVEAMNLCFSIDESIAENKPINI